MIRLLLSIFRPLGVIAKELTIIRQLYEADLAAREQPIYRITEKATKDDTMVTYAGVSDERPKHKRWFDSGEGEEDGSPD